MMSKMSRKLTILPRKKTQSTAVTDMIQSMSTMMAKRISSHQSSMTILLSQSASRHLPDRAGTRTSASVKEALVARLFSWNAKSDKNAPEKSLARNLPLDVRFSWVSEELVPRESSLRHWYNTASFTFHVHNSFNVNCE
jgi:hypothetical protein